MNGTEYLALVEAAGLHPDNFPACQPLHQHKIWAAVGDKPTPENV
jgi:hypothetical protein